MQQGLVSRHDFGPRVRRSERWITGALALGIHLTALGVGVASTSRAATSGTLPRGESKGAQKDRVADEIPIPSEDDSDRDRVRRLQDAIGEIVHNRALGRIRVGLRVMSARTGRLFYGRRADVLMDPASNQKVLATTAALMRLGADWRFRTEVSGPEPDGDGTIAGNVRLRGNGDPSLRAADLEDLAAQLRARGVARIEGGIIGDSRRLGDDGAGSDGLDRQDSRVPLIVDRGITVVRVRPGPGVGDPVTVLTDPAQPLGGDERQQSFLIRNQAVTKDPGTRARIGVRVGVTDGRLRIEVTGRLPLGSRGVVFKRRVPHPALHAAILLRAALIGVGIIVRDRPGTVNASTNAKENGPAGFVEVHRSPPLEIVLRKINKDSDNDKAERLLQTVGAEARGGAATTEKGLGVLREVIGGLGLRPGSYLAKNGSGLGHANLITPHAMADLLRALYLDPRVGPEILQSLSVGGIDGTTRNRFKGTLSARRVRAKTGTLNSKSCLSGLVGDGGDVMVFSMMVQGFRGRSNLHAVRASQVGAVNAMMRYVREGGGERIDLPPGFEEPRVGTDIETGGENPESPESGEEGEGDGDQPTSRGTSPKEDAVDAFLRQSRLDDARGSRGMTGGGGGASSGSMSGVKASRPASSGVTR